MVSPFHGSAVGWWLELPWDYLPKVQITQECGNRAYVPRKRTNHLILNFPLLVFILNLSEITLYHVQSYLCLLSLPFSKSHSDDEGNLGVLCRSDCLVCSCSPVCKSMGRTVSVLSKTAPSLQDCYPVQMQSQFVIHCFAPRAMQENGQDRQQFECLCRNVLQKSPAVSRDPSDLVSRTH